MNTYNYYAWQIFDLNKHTRKIYTPHEIFKNQQLKYVRILFIIDNCHKYNLLHYYTTKKKKKKINLCIPLNLKHIAVLSIILGNIIMLVNKLFI